MKSGEKEPAMRMVLYVLDFCIRHTTDSVYILPADANAVTAFGQIRCVQPTMINRPLHAPLVQHVHTHTLSIALLNAFSRPRTHAFQSTHLNITWIPLKCLFVGFVAVAIPKNCDHVHRNFCDCLFGHIVAFLELFIHVRGVMRSPSTNRMEILLLHGLHHFYCDLVNAVSCRCVFIM